MGNEQNVPIHKFLLQVKFCSSNTIDSGGLSTQEDSSQHPALKHFYSKNSEPESKLQTAIHFFHRIGRKKRFDWELKEHLTEDILDKALIKAQANKYLGAIDAPTYHALVDKINALKKLKFTIDYESWKDKETSEWMKYKVAAEVGGSE